MHKILTLNNISPVGLEKLPKTLYNFGPDIENPDFLAAHDKVLAAAKKWGKPAGIYAFSNNIEWVIEKGFTLITLDSADAFLMRGALTALKKAKAAMG